MTTGSSYEQELAAWRREVEETLRAEDGWLSVIALVWLREGDTTIGADAACDVALPTVASPREVGRIAYDGRVAVLHAAPGAEVRVNGEPIGASELRPDVPGPPDVVAAGEVTFALIRRGGRLGVRVRHRNSPARLGFVGRRWYPPRDEYRVEAAFTPYDPPRTVAITSVLGDVEQMAAAGVAAFRLHGQELRLEALERRGGGLWFIFRDATSGNTTYPASRFLYTAAPRYGRVTLDFNRAVSPPCAFTEHATCPLPPPGNQLPVPIEAGERYEAAHV
jgi:uncharacterized protein (DUF1684 family)